MVHSDIRIGSRADNLTGVAYLGDKAPMIAADSHHAVIRVYDDAGNVIETQEHAGEASTYTRLGSILTISGERDAPRCL
jgi:hypothetical protein